MLEQELELSIGDVLHIGEYTVTVIDIDGGTVSFRFDTEEDGHSPVVTDQGNVLNLA